MAEKSVLNIPNILEIPLRTPSGQSGRCFAIDSIIINNPNKSLAEIEERFARNISCAGDFAIQKTKEFLKDKKLIHFRLYKVISFIDASMILSPEQKANGLFACNLITRQSIISKLRFTEPSFMETKTCQVIEDDTSTSIKIGLKNWMQRVLLWEKLPQIDLVFN